MMKKVFVVLLSVMLLLGMTACGTINNVNVAVLWSDSNETVSPYSLINAMDRAMYIKNVGYDYYGAEKDAAKQLEQAQTALDAGCSALLVELVKEDDVQLFIDMAKAKNVPVIFFNCNVAADALATYDKSYLITTDEATLVGKQEEMIKEYFKTALDKGAIKELIEKIAGKELFDTPKNVDRNKDGKVSFVVLGNIETTIKTGDKVTEESGLIYEEIEKMNLTNLDPDKVELIITDDDQKAMAALLNLQTKGLNTDKLATEFVPIFTVNNKIDYKGYVMKNAPEDEAKRKAYFEQNRFLVDMTAVKAEDIDAMIYTTANVIDDGRISGTAMADYDAIAESVASITANLLKGNDAAKGIEGMDNRMLKISYTAYAAK